MKKLWFKAKRYGWGWYPSTWQGWLIILAHVIVLLTIWIFRDPFSQTVKDTIALRLILTIISTIAVIAICYIKGETPRWRWGR